MQVPEASELVRRFGSAVDIPAFGGRLEVNWVFRRGSERELDEWLSEVYEVLLSFKYILDIDNTVKPIYGHQEGAELGYNPIKSGRPSHNYHSFFNG